MIATVAELDAAGKLALARALGKPVEGGIELTDEQWAMVQAYQRKAGPASVTDANRKLLEQMEAEGLTPDIARRHAKRRSCCDPPEAAP